MSVERANEICRRNYGDAPTIDVLGNVDLTFTYIPSHMGYMFFELLKNSLRATMEKHKDAHRAIPNVKVIIAGGEQDVTIKIEDEGGGIRRSDLGRVWTYFYTTAIVPEVNDTYTGDFDPMAGLGYGLPLARLYARYFGGDLSILSMEGYGTDAYLYLNRLGDQQEALP
jgi:pyruvate dehydrogenase kinase 2/3/4